jgi:methionyl-tRNA formyltransferase
MRVAFFGNHDVGIAALSTLAQSEEIVAVVAHPPDPEEGVRYACLHDYAASRGWPRLRGRARDAEVAGFVRAARPDLIWITDYRYLLPPALLALAPLGAVNLHPSLLPRYRGRAPVNWAILEGETELGLTAHYVDAGMDSGNILVQARFLLSAEEDVGDALAKLLLLYQSVTRRVVEGLRGGSLESMPQDARLATTRPARRPEDGLIDWRQPAIRVRDLIRAVAAPYPGAFTCLHGHKIMVWQARLTEGECAGRPGEVVDIFEGLPVVRCGEGMLRLLSIDLDGPMLKVGDCFDLSCP